VGLVEPVVELVGRDRPPPQIAVLGGARRDNAEPAAGAGADAVAPGAFDHRGIDLILGAVTVDGGPRSAGNHRAAAALQRAPHQPVDERVLERGQRRLACRGEPDQPVGIFAARVRHRQQDGQLAARLMDSRGGEFVHGQG